MTEEAQCPECNQWSQIEWQGSVFMMGPWWKDSCNCPKCDALVMVESECNFRDRKEE